MRDINHFLSILGDLAGIQELSFDSQNRIEFAFKDDTHIGLQKIDDKLIGLIASLDKIDFVKSNNLENCLRENLFNKRLGSARFALHPVEGGIVICDTIDVTTLNAHEIEKRIVQFLNIVRYWNTPSALELINASVKQATNIPLDQFSEDFIIRI